MSHIRTANGRCIYYDEYGTGAPVLLIPGLGGYRRGSLVSLAEALATSFRVVSMDNRDSGESEAETKYYGLGDLAADALALLDALGIERTHALAHSMGGAIALRLALDHPARLDRLVLMSPGVGGEPEHRAGEPLPPPAAWWVDDPVARTRHVLPIVVGPDYRARMSEAELTAIAELERGNRVTWAGMMRREAAASDDDQVLSRLADINTPALVIHGDADGSVPLADAQALATGIPCARLIVLPGVGHRPWLESPDATLGPIMSFLAAGQRTQLSGHACDRREPSR